MCSGVISARKKCQPQKGAECGRPGTVTFTAGVRKGLLVKIAFGREPNEGKEKVPGVLVAEGPASAKILWQKQG